jgi:DNA-binding response OmpR family regulator
VAAIRQWGAVPASGHPRNSLISNGCALVSDLHRLPGVGDRLLVIDDDEAVLRTYEAHFGRAGFEVQRATSLKQAAERLAGSPFDAVIADVCLTPGGGPEGLSIAAYLRNGRQEPPVIVLTAYGEPDHAEAAARLGADAFLHKPVSLVWLEGLLRSRIGDRRGPAVGPSAAA